MTVLAEHRPPTPEDLDDAVAAAVAATADSGALVDVEQLRRRLAGDVSVFVGDAAVLFDPDADHRPWLDGNIAKINWRFWEAYADHLERRVPRDVVRSLDDITKDILDRSWPTRGRLPARRGRRHRLGCGAQGGEVRGGIAELGLAGRLVAGRAQALLERERARRQRQTRRSCSARARVARRRAPGLRLAPAQPPKPRDEVRPRAVAVRARVEHDAAPERVRRRERAHDDAVAGPREQRPLEPQLPEVGASDASRLLESSTNGSFPRGLVERRRAGRDITSRPAARDPRAPP